MSYFLLWIETLLACLLFLTFAITFGLRRKTRIARVLFALVALFPLLPPLAAVAFAGITRFAVGVRNNGFLWSIVLLACYLGGAIAIRAFARRRDAAGIQRAFSWPLARIATAWLVVVSLMAMTVWNLDLQAQVEIQALRAEAGALALSAAPPQIPDSANASFVYHKAHDSFVAATIPADKDVEYRDLDPRSPEVKAFLLRQQGTLELVRQAADMPQCRIEFDYARPDMAKLLAEWPKFRMSVRLLAIAAKAEAASGEVDLAVADCRRLYALAEQVGSAPALIGGLVTIVDDSLASSIASLVLGAVSTQSELDHFPSPDLHLLPQTFARSLRSEEALSLALYCDMVTGKGVFADNISPLEGAVMWFGYFRDDIVVYRRHLQRVQRIAGQPYYQTAAERKQLNDSYSQRDGGFLAAQIVPSLLNSLRAVADAQVLRSVIVMARAATRYRLDHGDYPDSGQLLAPRYIESLPLDPFDGQPMRLKKRTDGSVAIYSVGADGKDDGGDVETKERRLIDVGIVLKMSAPR